MVKEGVSGSSPSWALPNSALQSHFSRICYVCLDDVGAVSYGQQTAMPLPKRKDLLEECQYAGGVDRR